MRFAATLAILLLAVPAQAGQVFDFSVLRDGNAIGSHRVEVTQQGDETHVRVAIALDVRLGFIPLYRYRHDSREVWRGDRLDRMQARTDDDGDILLVSASATDGGLQVSGGTGTIIVPRDTIPTSYWHPETARGRPLLDTQTGLVLKLERAELAPGRWRLAGDLNIELAYGAEGNWTGLWFRHKGSDFIYLPQGQEKRP